MLGQVKHLQIQDPSQKLWGLQETSVMAKFNNRSPDSESQVPFSDSQLLADPMP